MILSGCSEVISLGAVLPFLAVLSDPQVLFQQPVVSAFSKSVGITQASELVLPATLAFVIAALVAAFVRMTNLWLNGRLAAALGSDLSYQAYFRTLHQPYRVHVQRNSAAIINGTITNIGRTVAGLTAILQLITSSIVAVGLLIGLLIIDWAVALGAVVLFGSAYGLLAFFARKELRRNSKRISETSKQQIKALQEGLGAIRDVLLDNNQSTYTYIYQNSDQPLRRLQAKNRFLGSFPRYAVEALGLVAIAMLGGLIVFQKGSGVAVIPLLGALALGAQRLLPALQQVYSSWSALKGYSADFESVLSMINQPLPPQISVREPLQFCRTISLQDVHFRYGIDQQDVLQGLNLEINVGERVGLIGTTGSGKSTSLDVLMGLLEPTSGRILVDGDNIHDPKHPQRLAAWKMAIAHVPQTIYLSDSSIAENIAFGIPKDQIDMDRVKLAAKQAQISGFIEASAEAYQTFVGERGIRLSGGQRQRIGIARALYKQARVLVFDEATSSLDTDTEAAVMSAVENLSKELTIVMIAHRLSTVQNCDRVIRLANGTVLADGPPRMLLF